MSVSAQCPRLQNKQSTNQVCLFCRWGIERLLWIWLGVKFAALIYYLQSSLGINHFTVFVKILVLE